MTRALIGAVAALAVLAAPAGAAAPLAGIALNPSTTQAGANPDLAIDAQFALAPTDTDTAKDVALALPAGLVPNPTVAPFCALADLQADLCQPSSLVGVGTVTATAHFGGGFDATAGAPTRVYLVAPQSLAENARLGLVINTPIGRVATSGAVTLRTSPDVGITTTFSGLPNNVGGVPISIQRLQLTLQGTVNGHAFTRNPTSCAPAVTTATAVAYDASSTSAQSTFTPTGCAGLAYTPALTAAAALDKDGVAIATTIVQPDGQAASRRITLAFPSAFAPRLAAFSRVCNLPDPAACPESATVGTATVITPLQAAPLVGRVILVGRGGIIPGLTVLFPAPIALRLDGTNTLGAGALTTTFDGIPDVPLSTFEVRIVGGPNSVFTGTALCTTAASIAGDFTAHNGAVAHPTAVVGVTGCPPVAPAASISLRGLGGRRPHLSATFTPRANGRALKTVNIHLPAGLSLSSRGFSKAVRVLAGGRRVPGAARKQGRALRAVLPGAGSRKVTVTIARPSLRVSRGLARRVRARKGPTLRFTVGVRDAAGGIVSVHPKARAR